MKKVLTISFAALALASSLCGCYCIDVATNAALRGSELTDGVNEPLEHVLVSNYGWYLFNCIPLVCGNATPDASFPWKFFGDHVNPILLHDRMMEYADSKNADMKNLSLIRDEKVFFDIPGSDIPCPIPFLVCYQEVQLSSVLVKRETRRKAQETPKENRK